MLSQEIIERPWHEFFNFSKIKAAKPFSFTIKLDAIEELSLNSLANDVNENSPKLSKLKSGTKPFTNRHAKIVTIISALIANAQNSDWVAISMGSQYFPTIKDVASNPFGIAEKTFRATLHHLRDKKFILFHDGFGSQFHDNFEPTKYKLSNKLWGEIGEGFKKVYRIKNAGNLIMRETVKETYKGRNKQGKIVNKNRKYNKDIPFNFSDEILDQQEVLKHHANIVEEYRLQTQYQQDYRIFETDKNGEFRSTDVTDCSLTRIFNGSETLGGRLYASYQSISKITRQSLKIERAGVVENLVSLDFKSLHPALLAIRSNVICDDVYAIENIYPNIFDAGEWRSLIKKLVLKYINNSGSSKNGSFVSNINQFCFDNDIEIVEYFKGEDADKIIGAIEERNPYLVEYKGAGIGLELQKIESDVMIEAIAHFNKFGIPTYPVHDSIMIAEQHADELAMVLVESACSIVGISMNDPLAENFILKLE